MSDTLAKYNAAKRALAVACSMDEVKDIRDKAAAMRIYAMQAKDPTLIDYATEIRLRAERRAGEMLRDMEKNKGARGLGKVRSHDATTPRLADLGLNKSQSSRWQDLAALDDDDFEDRVAHAQQKASAAVDRTQQPKPKPRRKQQPAAKPPSNRQHTAARAGISQAMPGSIGPMMEFPPEEIASEIALVTRVKTWKLMTCWRNRMADAWEIASSKERKNLIDYLIANWKPRDEITNTKKERSK